MSIDKQCAHYCIDAIRAVMWETVVPEIPETVSLAELYNFARLHGVEAMVFHALEQLNMDGADPLWQAWQNRADMLLTQSMVQLAERDTLFEQLPAAGIKILPVKGCWLKEQYPQIDFRQMSDLDILIHPEDAEKAKALMLRQGYYMEEDAADNHDSYMKPPYMGVELHHSLLQKEDSCYWYYSDVWEKARAEEGYTELYRLKPEDEYIFYMLHLHKHVLYAGTGIRSFLDSVVYRKLYPDMDKAYLKQEYDKLGISAFVKQIELLSDCWFDSGEPVPERLEAMAENILSAGTYGSEERRFQNEMQQFRTKFSSPLMVKIAYLFSCLFLPLKAMTELYPILGKYPVLLPVFWIWRPISRLLFNRQALTNLLKQTDEEGEKIWSEFNWQEFQSK